MNRSIEKINNKVKAMQEGQGRVAMQEDLLAILPSTSALPMT
jgi:hypothetical protein